MRAERLPGSVACPVRGCAHGELRVDAPAARFHEIGDVLFAAVNLARKLHVDPELALRAASERFRGRVEGAEGLAASDGADWNDLGPEAQLAYYARARLAE